MPYTTEVKVIKENAQICWIYYTLSGGTPSHGLFRVQSSHIITPKLKISHFSEKGSFRMSSGAIHSGVPADEESFMLESVIILESPKSQIFTVQCLFTRQFALFTSRWTIFMRCMHINPLYTTKVFSSVFIDQTKSFQYGETNLHWNEVKQPHPNYLIVKIRGSARNLLTLAVVLQHNFDSTYNGFTEMVGFLAFDNMR